MTRRKRRKFPSTTTENGIFCEKWKFLVKRIVAVSATYVLDKRSVKYYTKKSVKSNIYTKA